MRRIPRLRQPSAVVLTQCLQTSTSTTTAASQHAVSRTAATTMMTTTSYLTRPRDFSTTPSRSFPRSRPAAVVERVPEIETDLVLPSREREIAPRYDDLVEDANNYDPLAEVEKPRVKYTPAETSHSLEVVGDLSEWFNKDEHLPKSKLQFERFAPEQKVTHPAMLEVCVRRAVVEALAMVQSYGRKQNLLLKSWSGRGSIGASKRALALGLEVNKGSAKLVGDMKPVLNDLISPDEETVRSDAARMSYPRLGQAIKLVATYSESWKKISLEDMQLKFLVTKRIYQLTGHEVPDAKLVGVQTVGELLAHIVKPPAPTKVYDAIRKQGELTRLPNVEVRENRRTPITEARKVGSWKVIKGILQKRGLPVTGYGGVGKFMEDEWYRGPRVVKKGRKRP